MKKTPHTYSHYAFCTSRKLNSRVHYSNYLSLLKLLNLVLNGLASLT